MDYLFNGRVWGPQGNHQKGMAPHNTFPCKGEDEWIAIAVGTQQEWEALCEVMGWPEWAKGKDFADELARYEHRHDLEAHLAGWTRGYSKEDLMARLQAAGLAAMPCFSVPELLETPHFKEREALLRLDHSTYPQEPVPGVLWKLSETPGAVRKHAPLLGGDNRQVFGDLLGLTESEIGDLEREGVLY